MTGSKQREQELVVFVERDSVDGRLLSGVCEWPRGLHRLDSYFVVDRQKGRQYDADVVRSRARSRALILGFRYVEDLRWTCQELQLRACRCPRCVGASYVMNSAEPQPVRIDPETRQPVEAR